MAGRIAALTMLAALTAAPLAAQDPSPSAEDMVETARDAYGPPRPKPRCDKQSEDPDVIVVCGALEDQDQFRVRTDEDAENDYAKDTMNKGAPRSGDIPGMDGPGIFKGPATFKLAPPTPPLIIDLDEIPEAPEGSDAERIGSGEQGS